MAPSTIRKAIGAVKDQTSIGIAKVASNMAPELEVAVVKATSHEDDPAHEKYVREILNLTSYSRGYVSACVVAVSKRLSKTRDWIVAVKALMLVHRLMSDGDPEFKQEILYATRRGSRLLNMSDFRDEAHSSSWDQSAFVRTYGLYLDQKLELMLYERKQSVGAGAGGGSGSDRTTPTRPSYEYGGGFRDDFSGDGKDDRRVVVAVTPLREMTPERIFGKMGHLQRLLDRFLSCRPSGLAKNSRLVLIALYPVVKESFQLYADVCDILAILLDRFFDMEYSDCVKAFDAYTSAAKQIDELIAFYNWCKETGIARSSEFPDVQRITSKILETLEEFVRDRSKRPKSPERPVESTTADQGDPAPDMNEIKALPAPENFSPPPPQPEPQSMPKPNPPQEAEDLVNLREEGLSADDQGNKFALALFNGPPAKNSNGSWEAFPSNGQPEVTSAWQTPAAEQGKADWELALVETASNLEKQKAEMGGGMDPLLLNGMYDQGTVRQFSSAAQLSTGSASSVALPGPSAKSTQVLALPAPDGTVQAVGQDPFAASAVIPPPSYVQMADMEKKQHLLVQEQLVWQQYARNGMQGPASLAQSSAGGHVAGTMMPHGMQMPYGMPMAPPPAGYYYTQ